MENCLFCKIASREVPANILFENEQVVAFLDIHPTNPGHTLIIPKKHVVNVYELTQDDAGHFFESVPHITTALKKALQADGLNIIMNNDLAGGQAVFHAHIHMIPRFDNDGLTLWHGNEMSSEESLDIAQKIKNAL